MKLIEAAKIDTLVRSTKSAIPKERREQLAEHVRSVPAEQLPDLHRVLSNCDLPKDELQFVQSLFEGEPANVVSLPAAAGQPANEPAPAA